MSSQNKSQTILIVGAGCFGLSTAYQLATEGYTNITVLDRGSAIPSPFSAANDMNKIIRAEYADTFYTDLSLKALQQWQTHPLFAPYYYQRGFLNVTSTAAPESTRKVIQTYLASIQTHPAFEGKVQVVQGEEAIKKIVPAFHGLTGGWSGYINKLAGYSHSANAIRAVYEACVKLGVQFRLGDQDGHATALLYASSRSGTTCIGVRTAGGQLCLADKTILALGAAAASLLPQLGKQVTGRCWGVAHIQLTPEEAAPLRGIPVVQVRDLAFFFEPDPATNKLKFCHMGGPYSNYAWSRDGLSVPFDSLEDSQFLPADDAGYIRQLLREVLPELADRPLVDKHLCWVADTDDSDFIIDYVPGTGASLVVLSGDSGHGFKMLPIFGAFVQTLLDHGAQAEPKWQWKVSTTAGAAWRGSASQELASVAKL